MKRQTCDSFTQARVVYVLFRSQVILQKGRLFVVPHQRGQRLAGLRCQRHREEEIEATHGGEDTSG